MISIRIHTKEFFFNRYYVMNDYVHDRLIIENLIVNPYDIKKIFDYTYRLNQDECLYLMACQEYLDPVVFKYLDEELRYYKNV